MSEEKITYYDVIQELKRIEESDRDDPPEFVIPVTFTGYYVYNHPFLHLQYIFGIGKKRWGNEKIKFRYSFREKLCFYKAKFSELSLPAKSKDEFFSWVRREK